MIVPPALSSGGHAEQLAKTSEGSLRLLLETADMRVVSLTNVSAAPTALEALGLLAAADQERADGRRSFGVAFLPLMRRDRDWLLWCPHLGRDGRCQNYANQPEPCWRWAARS